MNTVSAFRHPRGILQCVLCALILSSPALMPLMLQAKTDLPLPRFVSVRLEEANIRTGPGYRYPIKWVLQRRDLPLEVIAEYENWRKVRDIQGDEGWIHRAQVSNKRTVMVIGETQVMHERIAPDSPPVARVEVGVQGDLQECHNGYCLVLVQGNKGWIDRTKLWGIYPNEFME